MESEILRLVGAKPVRPWSVLALDRVFQQGGARAQGAAERAGGAGRRPGGGRHLSLAVRAHFAKDADCLGYPKDFTIYDTDESRRLMKECIREAGLDDKKFPPPKMLGIIGRAKDALQGPEEFAAQYKDDFGMRHAIKLYAAYQARLAAAGRHGF